MAEPGPARERIAGVLLAGGRSSRMGSDKAFARLGGETLVRRAARRLTPQVAALAVSSNADPAGFADLALPVLPDTLPDRPGPLAGIVAGLRWAAREVPAATHLLSSAVDTPFFPVDLAVRLAAGAGGGIAVAMSNGRIHPVFALWPVALADAADDYLRRDERRSVMGFLDRCGHVPVVFEASAPDPFFNVNAPGDLAAAETALAGL